MTSANHQHCVLCQSPSILRESHVQSKFLWKDSGIACGPGKTYNAICMNFPNLSRYKLQDGLKEYLLCESCEQKRGKLEDYVKRKFYGKNGILTKPSSGHRIEVGLDFAAIKLFQMFNLFMMGMSRDPFYAMVNLGPKHETQLRAMLLRDDPGEPWQYACACSKLRAGGELAKGLFNQPQRFKMRNRNCYRMAFAGMHWFMWCSSQPPVGFTEPIFVSRAGEWAIFDGNIDDLPYLRRQISAASAHLGYA